MDNNDFKPEISAAVGALVSVPASPLSLSLNGLNGVFLFQDAFQPVQRLARSSQSLERACRQDASAPTEPPFPAFVLFLSIITAEIFHAFE